jgi:undecaprenyl-diphosphatase
MSGTFLYGFLAYVAFLFPLPAAARVSLAVASCAVIVASGPANVWLGVHWPSDVAGGYAWGAVVLLAAVFACERWRQR